MPPKKKIATNNSGADKSENKASSKKASGSLDEEKQNMLLNARKRTSQSTQKTANNAFSMDDVEQLLASKPQKKETAASNINAKPEAKEKEDERLNVKQAPINHAAASIADILGYNPAEKPKQRDDNKVPAGVKKYYKALLELRTHVSEGVALHTADTLKRSSKEDSGDLSGYGQHMADAGTDAFDRDFALSVLSNEQEALYEIEEAIQRIFENNYGVCEITGKRIDKERLMAVPFTRYSLEGQRQLELTKKSKLQRGGIFSDIDDVATITDDDDDGS